MQVADCQEELPSYLCNTNHGWHLLNAVHLQVVKYILFTVHRTCSPISVYLLPEPHNLEESCIDVKIIFFQHSCNFLAQFLNSDWDSR